LIQCRARCFCHGELVVHQSGNFKWKLQMDDDL